MAALYVHDISPFFRLAAVCWCSLLKVLFTVTYVSIKKWHLGLIHHLWPCHAEYLYRLNAILFVYYILYSSYLCLTLHGSVSIIRANVASCLHEHTVWLLLVCMMSQPPSTHALSFQYTHESLNSGSNAWPGEKGDTLSWKWISKSTLKASWIKLTLMCFRVMLIGLVRDLLVIWGIETDTTADIIVLFVWIVVLKKIGFKMSDILV